MEDGEVGGQISSEQWECCRGGLCELDVSLRWKKTMRNNKYESAGWRGETPVW